MRAATVEKRYAVNLGTANNQILIVIGLFIRQNLPLFGILALGTIVRFWGIGHLLPYNHASDEQYIVNGALWIGKGVPPEVLGWPATTVLFLVGFVYLIIFGAGKLLGVFSDSTDFLLAYLQDPTLWYLIPRVITALSGVATIPLVFLLGKRMFNARVGLLAAFFLAVSPLHASASKLAMVDIQMTMMVVLTLLFCHRIMTGGRLSDYVFAGVSAALATATKFNAGLLIIAILAAHVLVERRSGLAALLRSRKIWSAAACYALAFYSAYPYLVTNFQASVWSIIKTPFVQASSGQLGGETLQLGWLFLATEVLPGGMGIFVAALSAIGILYSLWRRNASFVLIFALLIPYFLLLGQSRTIFERYALPMVPLLALFAAVAIDRAIIGLRAVVSARSSAHRSLIFQYGAAQLAVHDKFWNIAAVLVAIGIAIPSISPTIYDGYEKSKADTRLAARSWIHETVPGGATIAIEEYGPYLLPTKDSLLRERRWWQEGYNYMGEVILKADKTGPTRYTKLITSEPQYDLVYTGLSVADPNEQVARYRPEWVVISSLTYERYMEEVTAARYPNVVKVRRSFYQMLDRDYRLAKVFEPDGRELAGPTIKIYRRNG